MAFLSCDHDGFLVDTEYALAVRVAEIATHEGFPLTPDIIFAHYSGGSSENKFKGIAAHFNVVLAPDQLQYLVGAHRKAKKAIYFDTKFCVLFNGVAQALDVVKTRAQGLWICSNSLNAHVKNSLAVTGLAHYFNNRVYTHEDVGKRMKPDPAMILHAMKVNGAAPSDTIHLGDTLADAEAGRGAGAYTVIYVDPRFGGQWDIQAQKARDAGAFDVFRDFKDLPGIVERCAAAMQPQPA